MKTIEELQKQLDQAGSAVTRFEILKIMAGRAVQLQKENDELKAHCEFLRECCHRFGNGLRVEKDEVDSIPQQSLCEIKAQAIDGAIEGITWKLVEDDVTDLHMILISDLRDYANKLRGEK